jgi:hypothetical protein
VPAVDLLDYHGGAAAAAEVADEGHVGRSVGEEHDGRARRRADEAEHGAGAAWLCWCRAWGGPTGCASSCGRGGGGLVGRRWWWPRRAGSCPWRRAPTGRERQATGERSKIWVRWREDDVAGGTHELGRRIGKLLKQIVFWGWKYFYSIPNILI